LDRRAAHAKAAIQDALAAFPKGLVNVADLKAWAKKFPLPTTGAVAAAGVFVGSRLFGPSSPKKSEEKKESAGAEAMAGEPAAKASFTGGDLWPLLIASGTEIIKSVVVPLAEGFARSRKGEKPQDEERS
jgi:hypothetical protein